MSAIYTIERRENGWHKVTTGTFLALHSSKAIRALALEHPDAVGVAPTQKTRESYSDGTRLYTFTLRQLLDFNSKYRPTKARDLRWTNYAPELGIAMRRMLPFGQDPDNVRIVTPNAFIAFEDLADLQRSLPQ